MCDTLIALGGATADGSVIFAKNSDREPNEAAEVISVPACDHPSGSTLQCTYINIPQAEHTHRLLLAKPFWIWGAEMGVNEHGVMIGNEAIFTRVPREEEPGLIGMDLLRLGLERAETARGALSVITELLAEYGQGGNCGFAHPFYYDNSYLIGDRNEAWILETFGREWAAVQTDGVGAISNALTIGSDWDLASDRMVDFALENGWAGRIEGFDVSRTYGKSLLTHFGGGAHRRSCSTNWLGENQGKITVKGVMQSLRGHGHSQKTDWPPAGDILSGVEVCMHAGYGPVRIDQTTSSMIVRLGKNGINAWVTASAAPCTAVFKPVWMDAGMPNGRPAPKGTYDPQSVWWKHEKLHRAVVQDYSRLNAYSADRDALEDTFIEQANQASDAPLEVRKQFSEACFERAEESETAWVERIESLPVQSAAPFYYRSAWDRFNREAQFPGK